MWQGRDKIYPRLPAGLCVRDGLIVGETEFHLAEKLKKRCFVYSGVHSKLRQVSAGGCNAREADINVLSTIVFDLGRFGIQFVASPRHADGIPVTGSVSNNMALALEKTYAAIPSPKIVIASGPVPYPAAHSSATWM